MRFVIEIVRRGDIGAPYLLYRAPSYAFSSKRARVKARRLLDAYHAHGANAVRITNGNGLELYSWWRH